MFTIGRVAPYWTKHLLAIMVMSIMFGLRLLIIAGRDISLNKGKKQRPVIFRDFERGALTNTRHLILYYLARD